MGEIRARGLASQNKQIKITKQQKQTLSGHTELIICFVGDYFGLRTLPGRAMAALNQLRSELEDSWESSRSFFFLSHVLFLLILVRGWG